MLTRDKVYSDEKCEEVTTYMSNDHGAKDISVAEKYYDLVTDFYEIGWGKSFHFAPQTESETFKEAILKHEMALAHALQLKPGMKVLDAGCGVAGPLINIAKATGASIDGITICEYQVEKGTKNIEEAGLADHCRVMVDDFMGTKFDDNSYDAVFALETTCHAPDKTKCFKELFRVLKPGQLFGGYEWCVTPKYDPNNPEHKELIDQLEFTSSIQRLETFDEVQKALTDAGFEVLETRDAATADKSWARPLVKGWRRKKWVRACTDFALKVAEKFGRVPKGSVKVASYLEDSAALFIEAEKQRLFTPAYFFLARKPKA